MEVDILKVVGANSIASPRGFQCIVLASRPADRLTGRLTCAGPAWAAPLCSAHLQNNNKQ